MRDRPLGNLGQYLAFNKKKNFHLLSACESQTLVDTKKLRAFLYGFEIKLVKGQTLESKYRKMIKK